MKKKDLLKLKSLIMAGVMATSLSACSKDNSESKEDIKNYNYSIVVMENNKAIIYDVSGYSTYSHEQSTIKLYIGDNTNTLIPASKAFIFRDENHHEEALKFAYYYCDDVIMYSDLMDHSLEDIKDQKLNLSK